MNLLSVDWDFFFPVPASGPDSFLYDWGHQEAPFFITGPLWPIRASVFWQIGRDLPGLSGDQVGFWDRFRIADGATLYLAESHSAAAEGDVRSGITHVSSFDAHHDLGYRDTDLRAVVAGTVSCGAWALFYALSGADVRVRYPAWMSDPLDRDPLTPACPVPVDRATADPAETLPVFDRVFVCRSGAWVPPWHDDAFLAFVAACPVADTVDLDPGGFPLTPWPWQDAAQAQLAVLQDVHFDPLTT